MSDTPKFEFPDESEVFQIGDEVYAIDDNEFDIYEGTIEEISSDGQYTIYFPEYENSEVKVRDQLLFKTQKNQVIFKRQDNYRRKLEDREQRMKERQEKKQKNLEEKQRKKEERLKQQKLHQLKKEKKPKQSKTKQSKGTDYKLTPKSVVKAAYLTGVNELEDFIRWLQREKDSGNPEKVRYLEENDDLLQATFSDQMAQFAQSSHQDIMDYSSVDDYSGSYYSDEEKEEIKEYEPEHLIQPIKPSEVPKATLLSIVPGSLSISNGKSREKPTKSTIKFSQGQSNAFIYRTFDKQYLILDGMKFEIKTIPSDGLNSFLYSRKEVKSTQDSSVSNYQLVEELDVRNTEGSISLPPEYNQAFTQNKKVSKKESKIIVYDARNEQPTNSTYKSKSKSKHKQQDINENFLNEDSGGSDSENDYSS